MSSADARRSTGKDPYGGGAPSSPSSLRAALSAVHGQNHGAFLESAVLFALSAKGVSVRKDTHHSSPECVLSTCGFWIGQALPASVPAAVKCRRQSAHSPRVPCLSC